MQKFDGATFDLWIPANEPGAGADPANFTLSQSDIPADFQPPSFRQTEIYQTATNDVSGTVLVVYVNDVITGSIPDQSLFRVKTTDNPHSLPVGSLWVVSRPAEFFPKPKTLRHWEIMVKKNADVPTEIATAYP